MPSRAAKLFMPLPDLDPVPDGLKVPMEADDIPLAQGLIDRCLAAEPEVGVSGLRASCLAVRIARRMLWPSELLDLAHLACLGRQDNDCNRDGWAMTINPVLRVVVRECEDNPDLLALVRFALVAERLVREEGVFHGISLLMRQKASDQMLDAAWDLRYDDGSWLRLETRPAQESILHAGRLGLSPLTPVELATIPVPSIPSRKTA